MTGWAAPFQEELTLRRSEDRLDEAWRGLLRRMMPSRDEMKGLGFWGIDLMLGICELWSRL